jgi:SAM-dependent methyltransferase
MEDVVTTPALTAVPPTLLAETSDERTGVPRQPPTSFKCRACGSGQLAPVLSLGETPLANSLLECEQLDAPEPRFPLELVLCGSCSLVQITETVPPDQLFSNYPYFSSVSDTMVRHAEALVNRLVTQRALGPTSLVLEVASNDGYLLRHYRRHEIPVLGIEPAANIAAVAAKEHGIPTMVAFFSHECGCRIAAEGYRADIVHANNVFAHVPDPGGFLRGIGEVLKENGMAVIEVPYVKDLIDSLEFDTIYHEHLSYFSVTAVERLACSSGLVLADVERLAIHGGSLRLFLAPAPAALPSENVIRILAEETAWGVRHPELYVRFAERVAELKNQLVGLLRRLKSGGRRIAAYGASAKGSTLLNTFGIGRDILDFVVDRSTVKQGRYTPGIRLPIVPPAALLEQQPDYVLLLTWNFADEILAQQAEFRRRGGRFIIPLPMVRII